MNMQRGAYIDLSFLFYTSSERTQIRNTFFIAINEIPYFNNVNHQSTLDHLCFAYSNNLPIPMVSHVISHSSIPCSTAGGRMRRNTQAPSSTHLVSSSNTKGHLRDHGDGKFIGDLYPSNNQSHNYHLAGKRMLLL